jgi:hypothetical protein
MKSWLKIAGLSLVVGSVAVACTISEGDPDNDGIGGAYVGEGGDGTDSTGGTQTTTGGTEAGGVENGGTAPEATGGVSEAGGSAPVAGGAGGAGGAEPGAGGSTPGDDNPCLTCMETYCPEQLNACAETADVVDSTGVDPDTGESTPNGMPDCVDEFVSYQSCMEKAWTEDALYYNEAECDSAAVLSADSDPLLETNDLINCVLDVDGTGNDCITECLDFSDDASVGAGGAGGAAGG